MQIAQEGAIQIFTLPETGWERVIVGVVGMLQLEVLEYRMQNEYGVTFRRRDLPHQHIRFLADSKLKPGDLTLASDTLWVEDIRGRRLLVFSGEWSIRWALDKNPGLELLEFDQM